MSKATLIIEDSDTDGCVNIHFDFTPQLEEGSQAHHLMARVLENLKTLIADQVKEPLCALKLVSSQSDTPAT